MTTLTNPILCNRDPLPRLCTDLQAQQRYRGEKAQEDFFISSAERYFLNPKLTSAELLLLKGAMKHATALGHLELPSLLLP